MHGISPTIIHSTHLLDLLLEFLILPELVGRHLSRNLLKPLYEIAGFQLLARLFANGKEPNERGINEFLDQAAAALQGDNMGIKHAASNAVLRFCDFGEDFEQIARGALKGIYEI